MLRELDVGLSTNCGVATYPPGATYGPRQLRDYEFVWMIAGDAQYRRGDERMAVPAGSVVLCRPGPPDFFQWDRRQRTRHGYFHFQANALPAHWPPPAEWPLVRLLPEEDILRPLFRHLLTWQGHEDEAQCQLAVAHVLSVFLSGHLTTGPLERAVWPEAVERAWEFLHRSLEADAAAGLSLAQLASAASVTPEHLCRLFQASLGHSPMKAVRLARLDIAAGLLVRSNYSVGEVSALCGFANPFHFSRVFKTAFGQTPAVMRRAVNAGSGPLRRSCCDVSPASANIPKIDERGRISVTFKHCYLSPHRLQLTQQPQARGISMTVVSRSIADRYRVSVEEYCQFRRSGFLVVRNLVFPAEVAELRRHTEELMQGKLPEQGRQMTERDLTRDGAVSIQGLEAPPAHLSPDEKAQYFLRIHMLHRKLELHERYLLHPRVLDVLEVLIGPDVLALQSMLFLKPGGKPGQGWHQDTFYIPTHPDTLCGAWIAIDDADEMNGAMWMAKGSHAEPVYPPREGNGHGDTGIDDIAHVAGVSDPDDAHNDLSRVADKYDQLLVSAQAGDVVFFGGHILQPLQAELHGGPDAPLVRRPLLQRPLVHAMGWRRPGPGGDGPAHGHDQRLAHSGARRHAPAVRPAPVRHPLRRPAVAGRAPPAERPRGGNYGGHGQRDDGHAPRQPGCVALT